MVVMYDGVPDALHRLVELIESKPGTFRGEFQLGYWGGVTDDADAWSIRVEADIEDTEFFVTAPTPEEALERAIVETLRRLPPAR